MTKRWNMMRDLETLQERMNSLFEDAAQEERRPRPGDEAEIERADWYPAADVYENDKEYLIALDLPGIERSALDFSFDENKLTIRGERSPAVEDVNPRRSERTFGRFVRSFGLPTNVHREGIAAVYKDGVLRLRLPKRAEQQARRVEIKVQ